MEVLVRAHQMPSRPSGRLKMIASGMRAPVKVMLRMLHRRVFPRPERAPTVVSSTHMKASLKPMMMR